MKVTDIYLLITPGDGNLNCEKLPEVLVDSSPLSPLLHPAVC